MYLTSSFAQSLRVKSNSTLSDLQTL